MLQAYFGKGYGRYATDHNDVYRTIPINLAKIIKKGDVQRVEIYDYDHNQIGQYENEEIERSIAEFNIVRNSKLPQTQIMESAIICRKLIEQLRQNSERFPREMYTIIMKELNEILNELEKGENEK